MIINKDNLKELGKQIDVHDAVVCSIEMLPEERLIRIVMDSTWSGDKLEFVCRGYIAARATGIGFLGQERLNCSVGLPVNLSDTLPYIDGCTMEAAAYFEEMCHECYIMLKIDWISGDFMQVICDTIEFIGTNR